MNFNIEKLDNGQVKVIAKIIGEEWNNALDEGFEKNKGKYVIEGFRKGKAPKSFVEKKYGRGSFIEDGIDVCMQKTYQDALKSDETIEPIAQPNVELGDVSLEECNFTITIHCMPKVTLGAYKGLSVKKTVVAVTDEMIDSTLTAEQSKQASFTEDTDAVVKNGDVVNIDFAGSVNGVAFAGGTAEKQDLTIGSGQFIPGFEEQLIGVKAGDEKDVTVSFPSDYHESTLAGQEAIFKCKVHFVKIKKLPEINDDFAKDISDFDTLVEYKADIKAKLALAEDEKAQINAENALVELIVNASTVTPPESLIEEQSTDSINEFAYRLKSQGLNIDDYYKYAGITADDLKKQYYENSKTKVTTKLVLDEIIKLEKITADEATIAQVTKEVAMQFGKKEEEMEEFIKTMPDNYKQFIVQQATSEMLIKFIKNNNQID